MMRNTGFIVVYVVGQVIGIGFLVLAGYRWVLDGASKQAQRAFTAGLVVIGVNTVYTFALAPLVYRAR